MFPTKAGTFSCGENVVKYLKVVQYCNVFVIVVSALLHLSIVNICDRLNISSNLSFDWEPKIKEVIFPCYIFFSVKHWYLRGMLSSI